jgi:hypothetical protein
MQKNAKIPTQAEQRILEQEAKEIKNSIIQKRDSQFKITSSNTQRLLDNELTSVVFYFFGACLLLLIKFLKPNPVNILLTVGGFFLSFIILFIFGSRIIILRKKQEAGLEQGGYKSSSLLLNFIPYIFGLYLIFVIGVYYLVKSFSPIYIPQAIAYALLGYLLIRKVRIIQELGNRIVRNK